ncbi:hypothetical protein [Paenibacillus sp. IHB B 3084]|uniref:hypothetical protein n=1 Tax=Paenibacillus sp. IHB B 3084 TaxID=867076 RepID=UPI000AE9AD29
MEYVKLGNTGLDVSRLCLGCMGFGVAERWIHPWILDEERSRPIIKKALELGINFLILRMYIQTEQARKLLGGL